MIEGTPRLRVENFKGGRRPKQGDTTKVFQGKQYGECKKEMRKWGTQEG